MAVRADAANNRGPVFLRSYTNPQTRSDLPECLVWQAGRATSAAPSYFTSVKVGAYELVDGGLLANNPLGWSVHLNHSRDNHVLI
jgi:predicted acylesterase/phospholipase RssA